MATIRVNSDYSLKIPSKYRRSLQVGQEVAINLDAQGRLIITPIEQVRAALKESFGMWADRTDIPSDSIEHMDELRKGHRLDDLVLRDQ